MWGAMTFGGYLRVHNKYTTGGRESVTEMHYQELAHACCLDLSERRHITTFDMYGHRSDGCVVDDLPYHAWMEWREEK